MAAKKLEKALYGPSMTEVVLGALLGLLVGVSAACVYLVFKEVPTVKQIPKEPVRGVVYYLPGSDSNAKSRGWEAKQKQFLSGATISLNEDELNAWANSIKAPVAAKPAPGAAPVSEDYFVPGQPNFRIVDGKIQIGLSCKLNWYGLATEVTVQATGDFRSVGSEFAFVPETVYLGSCPVHQLPGMASLLVGQILNRQKIPDEARAAWAKVSDISLEGSLLKLGTQ